MVAEIASGDIAIESIDTEALPSEMQAMAPAARQSYIEEKAEARKNLRSEIKTLASKRDAYLKQKVKAAGLEESSLDSQIFDAIREQVSLSSNSG